MQVKKERKIIDSWTDYLGIKEGDFSKNLHDDFLPTEFEDLLPEGLTLLPPFCGLLGFFFKLFFSGFCGRGI